MPMCLWSTLVIHSFQRYGSQPFTMTKTRIPSRISMTTAPAVSGIGWSKGMAFHPSLPSIMARPR